MAFGDSKNAVFRLDETPGGTLLNVSAFISEVSGLPGPRNLNEVTALGNSGAKFIPGLENVTFTIDGHYDASGTAIDDVIGTHRTGTVTASFEYSPLGTASGEVKFTGEAWCTTYEVKASVGSQVAFSSSFQVDGTVGRTAY